MKTFAFIATLLATGFAPLSAADPMVPIRPSDYRGLVKVACVGDSITQGSKRSQYPMRLQEMLGEKWEVKNFGHSGFTLLKKGDRSYWNSPRYQEALAYKPDVVVIKLGTNDTKPRNWQHKDEFVADYKALVESFQQLDSKPKVYLCLPCPVIGKGNWGINNAGIEQEMIWIRQLAGEMNLGLIDLNTIFAGKDGLIPDRVHPDAEGHILMAATVCEALTGAKVAK